MSASSSNPDRHWIYLFYMAWGWFHGLFPYAPRIQPHRSPLWVILGLLTGAVQTGLAIHGAVMYFALCKTIRQPPGSQPVQI